MEARLLPEALGEAAAPGLSPCHPPTPDLFVLHHMALFLGACLCPNPPFIRTRSLDQGPPLMCKVPLPDKATFTVQGFRGWDSSLALGRQFNPQHKSANAGYCEGNPAARGGGCCPLGPFVAGPLSPPGTRAALLPRRNLAACQEAPERDALLLRPPGPLSPLATLVSPSRLDPCLQFWGSVSVAGPEGLCPLPATAVHPGTPEQPRACSPARFSVTRPKFQAQSSPVSSQPSSHVQAARRPSRDSLSFQLPQRPPDQDYRRQGCGQTPHSIAVPQSRSQLGGGLHGLARFLGGPISSCFGGLRMERAWW